jgi:hypothetical protein
MALPKFIITMDGYLRLEICSKNGQDSAKDN